MMPRMDKQTTNQQAEPGRMTGWYEGGLLNTQYDPGGCLDWESEPISNTPEGNGLSDKELIPQDSVQNS